MESPKTKELFLTASGSRCRDDFGDLLSFTGRLMRMLTTLKGMPQQRQMEFDQLVLTVGGQPDIVDKLMADIPLVMKLIFCRSVDQFLIYISDLLTEIFTLRPEMIQETGPISVEYALQFSTREELLAALMERHIIALSFKGMLDLNRHLKTKYSFELFEDSHTIERASVLVERRNLITHNRGVVNRHYLERVPSASEKIGESLYLNYPDILHDIMFLTESMRAIDRRAHDKFGIPTQLIPLPIPPI